MFDTSIIQGEETLARQILNKCRWTVDVGIIGNNAYNFLYHLVSTSFDHSL
jgi:hypothetical protein